MKGIEWILQKLKLSFNKHTGYEWLANGMLAGVKTPDGKIVSFGYDALGHRVSKTVDGIVRRFGWDGNV